MGRGLVEVSLLMKDLLTVLSLLLPENKLNLHASSSPLGKGSVLLLLLKLGLPVVVCLVSGERGHPW